VSRVPSLTARKFIAALKRAGFVEHHQTGGHVMLHHFERGCSIIVPNHPGDLKRPLLKSLIKKAGLTEEEFIALL
jgi:predicted RNA binding protein YcfA (HicA-like mRNA interferase family)